MRWCAWFLVLVVAAGWLASEVPLAETPAAPRQQLDCWRRTRDGWERADWLTPPSCVRRPGLHPGVVGLLEVLVSTTALMASSLRAKPPAARAPGRSDQRSRTGLGGFCWIRARTGRRRKPLPVRDLR